MAGLLSEVLHEAKEWELVKEHFTKIHQHVFTTVLEPKQRDN